jgi:hypothetical protein
MRLAAAGHRVMWLPDGRSAETQQRAEEAGLLAVRSLERLAEKCDVVFSICPPYAALETARQLAGSANPFCGVFVDANAISPTTSASIMSVVITGGGARYVDGGLIGAPPPGGSPRLVLAGSEAASLADSPSDVALDIAVLGGSPTAASALKMTYAAWTKGSAALLLSTYAVAAHFGVDDHLIDEWERSQPELPARTSLPAAMALDKGWRWIGEMDEVAITYGVADLPDGFARAASEIFRRIRQSGAASTEALTDRRGRYFQPLRVPTGLGLELLSPGCRAPEMAA